MAPFVYRWKRLAMVVVTGGYKKRYACEYFKGMPGGCGMPDSHVRECLRVMACLIVA